MGDLRLSEIWIYPIKSLGGIALTSSVVSGKGLPLDRRWMLVDSTGKFMTQRLIPEMALFKLSLETNKLQVKFKDDKINVELRPEINSDPEKVTIWDDTVEAFEVGNMFNEWFSDHLKTNCKLVYFPESNPRPVDPLYSVNNENVSLADAYPFLIIGQSSLDDLNTRLEEKVPMNRFRPNFVFTGGKPYEEDTWRNFSIGKNNFVSVKPCARCVLTTVDQNSGKKGTEPLKTLAGYRTKNNKVLFGQNLVAVDHTEIKVGDPLTINSYQ